MSHQHKVLVCHQYIENHICVQAALSREGVVSGITAGKGYVDMSTVDEATSQQIAAAITEKGGRFLEVSIAHHCWVVFDV